MIDAESELAVGIDLGGSKIAAGLVDAKGNVIKSVVQVTPASMGGAAILDALMGLAGELVETARLMGKSVCAVGLASAGIVAEGANHVATVTEALLGWSDLPVVSLLTGRLGVPVVLVNDVQAMAMGETRFGVGGDVPMALYLAVGTGVGGAIAHEGDVYRGSHGSAGDIGHVLVDCDAEALLCGCGRRGHLEAYVSGPALAHVYARRIGREYEVFDLRAVVARARQGDAIAAAVLAQGGALLGRAIGGMVNFLDPDIVVFGGGLLVLGSLFWSFFEKSLAGEVRSISAVPRCEPARLGNDAAVVGSATLAFAHR